MELNNVNFCMSFDKFINKLPGITLWSFREAFWNNRIHPNIITFLSLDNNIEPEVIKDSKDE